MSSAMIKVWDLWVRIGHWSLVLCIAAAWLTRHGGDALHEWLGYGALVIVAIRIVWGMVGSAHARFSDFVFGPRAVIQYLGALRQHREHSASSTAPSLHWRRCAAAAWLLQSKGWAA